MKGGYIGTSAKSVILSSDFIADLSGTPAAGDTVNVAIEKLLGMINFGEGVSFATTVSASSTTTLTVNSAARQELTGTTTQNFKLPVATTLSIGQTFAFINKSTGIATIQYNNASTLLTAAADTYTFVICTNISTSNGVWTIVQSPTLTSGLLSSVVLPSSTTSSNGAVITAAASDIYASSPSSTKMLTPYLASNVLVYKDPSTYLNTIWQSGEERIIATLNNAGGNNPPLFVDTNGILYIHWEIGGAGFIDMVLSVILSNQTIPQVTVLNYTSSIVSVSTAALFFSNFSFGFGSSAAGSGCTIIYMQKNTSLSGEAGITMQVGFSGNGTFFNEATTSIGALTSSYASLIGKTAVTPKLITTQTNAVASSGNWTPVAATGFSGGSPTLTGTYVISGGLLYVQGTITGTAVVMAAGATITGLPVAANQVSTASFSNNSSAIVDAGNGTITTSTINCPAISPFSSIIFSAIYEIA